MPDRDGFAPGEFSWTDLMTDDPDAAATFYSTLFGWVAEPVPMPDAGGYTMLTLNGRYVGALSPKQQGDPGPSRWTMYVNVDDADKTAELVTAAGGTVLAPVMDVFTAGRMAVFMDPTGAAFAVWQPKDHKGAQVTDVPGALTWIELTTDDTGKAKAFYGEVFGWTGDTHEGGGMAYTEFSAGDTKVGGMMGKPPGMPAEVPSFWMPYFQTTDPDKAAGEITALGGRVVQGPAEVPGGGRFVVASDPQGAMFGLYTPAS